MGFQDRKYGSPQEPQVHFVAWPDMETDFFKCKHLDKQPEIFSTSGVYGTCFYISQGHVYYLDVYWSSCLELHTDIIIIFTL